MIQCMQHRKNYTGLIAFNVNCPIFGYLFNSFVLLLTFISVHEKPLYAFVLLAYYIYIWSTQKRFGFRYPRESLSIYLLSNTPIIYFLFWIQLLVNLLFLAMNNRSAFPHFQN